MPPFLSPPGGIACRTTPATPSPRVGGLRRRMRRYLHRIDPIAVEREIPLNFGNRRIGSLISPYRVDRFRPTQRNAVIEAVALVRAVSRIQAPLEPRHVGIFSGNVKNRWVTCLPEQHCVSAICDFNLRYAHDNARVTQFDGYRVIRSGELHSLGVQTTSWAGARPQCVTTISTAAVADFGLTAAHNLSIAGLPQIGIAECSRCGLMSERATLGSHQYRP